MLEFVLILVALTFYMWRLFVFANAFNNKKQIVKPAEKHEEEMNAVKRYSIHGNVYE